MKRRKYIALIKSIAFIVSVLPSPSVQADDQQRQVVADISSKEFSELHQSLVPELALWKTVPWQTSLLKAQNMAASEKKPIFIWSMDGHPLGCT